RQTGTRALCWSMSRRAEAGGMIRRPYAAHGARVGEAAQGLAGEHAGPPRDGARREHADAGDYAAAGISSASMSMSGYQRLNMTLRSPFSVCTRVCNNRCAPALDHCICCFLQKRLLTTSFTVDSTKLVVIASPWRYRSP